MESVTALRRKLRKRRRQLSAVERQRMNRQLCRRILTSHCFRNARHIAAYYPFGAEPDLIPVLEEAIACNKQAYLPRIRPLDDALTFEPWRPGEPLTNNRYGIPEPSPSRHGRPLPFLDLVLTPLVGFDALGHRIGMGAGFYDRAFGYRLARVYWRGPILLGTAWECQRTDRIPAAPWDVPLDAVVTERHWHVPPVASQADISDPKGRTA